MLDIAYILPAYNEQNTLKSSVLDALEQLRNIKKYNYKIFIIDNRSTDNTKKIALELANTYDHIIYQYEPIQGKGYVLRRAFQTINAKCYIMCDADHTYDQSKLIKFCKLVLEHNYDMVIGDRLSTTYYHENKRALHSFGNWFIKTAINTIFHTDYNDVLSGMRAFSYEFVKTFQATSGGFTLETELSIHAAEYHMLTKNIPIKYQDRTNSKSKINTIPDGIRIVHKFLKLLQCYKPVLFYTTMGILLLFPGIMAIKPVIKTNTKKLTKPIVGTLSIIAGIQLLCTGITQSCDQLKTKQWFEQQLCHYRSKSN